ncbi:hypothetical protein BCO18442_06383 [Burkholderia contaminans]|nr:hypothetical protein BCO18442_06383 [Burkholderia contaminans]
MLSRGERRTAAMPLKQVARKHRDGNTKRSRVAAWYRKSNPLRAHLVRRRPARTVQRLIDTVTFVPSLIVTDFDPPLVGIDTHFT